MSSQCRCLRLITRALCALMFGLFWVVSGYASELKIVDSVGLVRAIKVVRAPIVVVVTIENETRTVPSSGTDNQQECRAVNVDGLAADRSVLPDEARRCVFRHMPAGIWQLEIPQDREWKVHFDEE
jgi:hypothetical protein